MCCNFSGVVVDDEEAVRLGRLGGVRAVLCRQRPPRLEIAMMGDPQLRVYELQGLERGVEGAFALPGKGDDHCPDDRRHGPSLDYSVGKEAGIFGRGARDGGECGYALCAGIETGRHAELENHVVEPGG
jgi:hypothetical protein